ncbi:RHS repeat-associated core domain-containing protein [Catenuloplanes niger JCM 9533]
MGTAGRLLAATLGAVMAGTLLAVPPALAVQTPPEPLRGQVDAVDAHGGEVTGTAPVPQDDPLPDLPDPVWPTAGSARAVLKSSESAKAAGTPVSVARAGGEAGKRLPSELTVEVIDRGQVPGQWRDGVVLRVGGARGATTSGTASVSVDYSGFRHAYGAGWSSRLQLWQLPQCALTATDQSRCSPRRLPSVNDTATSTVTADATIEPIGGTGAATSRAQLAGDAAVASPAGTLIALAAAPSGPSGDFTATSLSPTSNWSVGGNSGSFNWSYGITSPPAHAGKAPGVAVSYSSSSVDGRSNASNSQPSWIGEGFDLGVGSIERRYVSCAEDTKDGANNTDTTLTGDLCWRTDNAVMSLNGNSTELVWDKDKATWRSRNEDGSKIEQVNKWTGSEYWKVTGTDGTEYYFGRESLPGHTSTTDSAWKVPVYGNHKNEPCNKPAFAESECSLIYRWNLDYVVDVYGNTQSYWYAKENNFYGTRVTATAKREYTRGGTLKRIDYGTWDRADGRSTTAVAQVVFDTGDRCLADCGVEANWYDTPLDQECLQAATECKDNFSPTFWSKKRLTRITTKVWDTTRTTPGWQDVTRWDFSHSFPSPGDGGDPGLWLKSIVKTGLVGGEITMPPVTFEHEPLPNRVLTKNNTTNSWQRLSKIVSETGASTHIRYTLPECTATNVPERAPANNMRCYPVLGPDPANPQVDMVEWWHKYMVESITENDVPLSNGAQSPPMVTRYTYDPKGPAWHFADDDGMSKSNRKTWSQFRGYEWVTTEVGAGAAKTLTKTRYLRGMHGDRASYTGGTRTVIVDASLGNETVYDEDQFAGMVRETIVYNGTVNLPVSKTVHVPWRSPATASRTINGDLVEARYLRNQTTYTAVAIGRDGARGWRSGRTHTTYDDTYGTVKSEHSDGDLAVTGDESCTTFEYNRNIAKNLLHVVKRTTSVALPCGTAPTSSDHIVADARSYYDGATSVDTAPTRGMVTKAENLKNWTPAGGTEWENGGQTTYDKFGRVSVVTDIKGGQTTTAYTPAEGGPTTKITSTNPLKWVSTIEFAPYWGSPTVSTNPNKRVTRREYDALGRFVRGWDAGWVKNATTAEFPTVRNTYVFAPDRNAYPYIKTETLHAGVDYRVGYTILDGLLRARQTQSAALDGTNRRVITDSNYDEYGRVATTYQAHVEPDAPSGTYWYEPEWSVPAVTKITYDLAGRTRETALWASENDTNLVKQWGTVTVPEGDRTLTIPPEGGTAATVYTDYQGRTTEVRAHNTAAGVDGPYLTTSYTYNRKGQLTKVTDPGKNEWLFTYDIKGRETSRKDPDAGTSSTVYNAFGEVETSTNGAGKMLHNTYDLLGRRTALRDDSATGKLRAQWKYDTLWTGVSAKGLLVEATRYDDNNPGRVNAPYTWQATNYTLRDQVSTSEYIIPDVEGPGLAGIWESHVGYAQQDGTPDSVFYPEVAGLVQETVTTEFHKSNGLPNALKTTMSTVGSYVVNQMYTAYGEPTMARRKSAQRDHYVENSILYDAATRRVTDVGIRPETGPTVTNIHYDYDDAGNILSINDRPGTGDAENQCFGYDALRRLTSAWTPANDPECKAAPSVAGLGGPAPYWTDWTIDDIGNRTKETHHTASGDTTTTYQIPASGPNSVRPHSVTSATTTAPVAAPATRSFTYDNAGNTVTRPGGAAGQALTWNAEGKLTSTVEGDKTFTNVYDANGSRLIRRDATGTTLYLPGMEVRKAASDGAITATRYYSFAGSAVASRNGPNLDGLSWIYGDHQGTQNLSINAGSYAVSIRRQTPYGEQRGAAVAWPNQKSFVGGDNDPNGLIHIGAREYDADLGRFISVDPVMDLADPQQWNAYSYAYNSPITNSDPTGLRPCDFLDCGIGGKNKFDYSHTHAGTKGGGTPGGTTSGGGSTPSGSGGGGNSGGGSSGGGGGVWNQIGSGIWNAGKNFVKDSIAPVVTVYNDFKNKGAGAGLASLGKFAVDNLQSVTCQLCTMYNQGMADLGRAADFIDAARAGDVAGMTEVVAGKGIEIGVAVLSVVGLRLPVKAPRATPRPARDPSPAAATEDAPSSRPTTCEDSFSGATLVLMADGSAKPIQDVVVGDEVLAEDPTTGEKGPQLVTHIWPHRDDLVTLEVDGGLIETTEDHLFWNHTDRQWQRVDALDAGDTLLTAEGERATIGSLTSWHAFDAAAYNLTVDRLHTYYVLAGNEPVLVHNCGGSPAFKNDPYHPDEVQKRIDAGRQAWATIPREVHSTVNGIESGAVTQRVTSAGPDWYRANGNTGSPWRGATIFTGVGSATTQTRVLVRSDGVVGFVTGHNYNKITEYGYAKLPQRYVAPPQGWS